MRRLRLITVLAAAVVTSFGVLPAGAAAPNPITEARHQLDQYFAHHPIHNRNKERQLKSCPIASLPHAESVLKKLTGKPLPKGRSRDYMQYDDSSSKPLSDQELECSEDIHPVDGKNNPIIDLDTARLYSSPHLDLPPTTRTVAFDHGTLHYNVSKRSGNPKFCGAVWLPSDQSYWVIAQYSSWKTPPSWASCETYGKQMVQYLIHSIDIMKTD